MENKDTRWRQRFQNFEKSLQYLEQALEIRQPDIIQKAGLIQFFEMSVELYSVECGKRLPRIAGIYRNKIASHRSAAL